MGILGEGLLHKHGSPRGFFPLDRVSGRMSPAGGGSKRGGSGARHWWGHHPPAGHEGEGAAGSTVVGLGVEALLLPTPGSVGARRFLLLTLTSL